MESVTVQESEPNIQGNGMTEKPSYEALEQRVKALEKEAEKRRQVELEFIKRQKYLESVLHHAPDAIITLDASHRVMEWNPGAETIFGYTGEEARGRDLDDLVSLADVEGQAHDNTRKILSGQALSPVESVRYRKDGTPVQVIASAAPILLDGKLQGVVALYTDISERKRAEEALKDSEMTYRNLYDNAQVGLGRTRISDGRVLESNAQMARIFGYDDVSTFIDDYVLSEHYVDPEVRPRIIREIREKGVLNNRELQFYRRDGSTAWVRFDTRIFPDKGYMEDVIIDITQEKKAQEESRRLERQLIQAQKFEALGTLTGGIAHDFNNILGIILGYTELAQARLPATDPSQKALDEVKTASLRARDIVSQLLTFARKGKEQLHIIDIRPIVKECLKMLRSTIPASVTFQIDIAASLDPVRVDATQIHQIMVNLCTNAWHAMESGGELRVELDNASLDADAAAFDPGLEPGRYVRLAVTDAGEGISREDLHNIFDPYFTTKELGKGSGLGLSVVLGIVKTYGGGIRVSSAIGQGTRFEVYLPAARGGEVRAESDSSPEIPKGRERVLFVDDEKGNVALNEQRLEGLGYVVTGMHDPLEALERIRTDPLAFDLLITDMTMPGISGDRFVRLTVETERPRKVDDGPAEDDILRRAPRYFLSRRLLLNRYGYTGAWHTVLRGNRCLTKSYCNRGAER